MSVRTDVINLNVNVNGDKAQNQMNQLRKKAADVKFEMDGLKRGTQEYINKKKELAGITAEMNNLKKEIGIAALNERELVKELKTLKSLKSSMQPFTDEWRNINKEIKAVEGRLYDVKNGVRGFSSFFSKIKDEVKQFGMLAAGYLGFQFLTTQFQNIIRGGAKLTDQLADIRRITGLTAEEVDILNNNLKKLDTRTSTESLRGISIIAGKLGVEGVQNLTDFTEAVDKLVVALGDELGDADQVTEKLGKILNVFEGNINGDNITRAGNALVDLANKGVASGGFIVDFTQRLGGIAKAAGLALPDVFALGAGIEEMGGRSESASTAIIKIINDIAKDIPQAAKIAGVSVEEFTKQFSENPTQALLAYSKGLVTNKAAFSDVVAAMKDAGEEGARVVSTISILGNNTGMFNKKILETKQAYKETGEITEAFRLKNETFGATLDKLGKEFNRLVTSPALVNFLQGAINAVVTFIKWLKALPDFIERNRFALIAIGFAIVTLNRAMLANIAAQFLFRAALILNTLWTGYAATATLLYRAAVLAATAATILFHFNVGRVVAAWKLLVLAFKASPIGFLVTGIIGIGLALDAMFSKSKKLTAQQRINNEIEKKASEIYSEQIAIQKQRLAIAANENVSLKAREKALNEAKKASDGYLNALTLENINQQQGINLVNLYIEALKRRARAQAVAELAKEKEKQKIEIETALDILNSNFDINSETGGGAFLKNVFSSLGIGAGTTGQQIRDLRSELSGVDQDLSALYAKIEKNPDLQTAIVGDGKTGGGGADDGSASPTKADLKAQNEALEKLKKEAEAFAKEVKKIQQDLNRKGKEADEAEITRIEDKYKDLLERAKKYSFDLMTIKGLEQKELRIFFDTKMKEEVEKRRKIEEEAQKKESEEQVKGIQERFEKFKKDNEDRQKIQEEELKANARLKILKTKPLSDDRIKAQKDYLQLQFELETAALDKRSALYKEKEKLLQNDLKEVDTESIKGRVERVLGYAQIFQDVMSSLANFVAAREERLLAKDRKANDEKKKNLQNQLKSRLISEAQYNIKVAQLDEELAKKETEIKRKQAKREKALNIFQSLINTASAIVEALPNVPLSIAVGIAGAIQTALIAATPLPSFGKGEWIKKGDKHTAASGGIHAMIERDEAVMAAAAMNDRKTYQVTGNVAQITSALNSRNGGAAWSGGARVIEMPAWWSQPAARINPNLPAIMQAGGLVRQISESSGNSSATMEQLLQLLIREQQLNTEEIKNMKTRLHAIISIKEFREAEAQYDTAKKVSGLNG